MPKDWTLWAYASTALQLIFRDDRLVSAGFVVVNKGAPALPPVLGGGPLPFTDRTRLVEFGAMLSSHAIPWVRVSENDDVVVLRTGSKVHAVFDATSGTLEKVHVGQLRVAHSESRRGDDPNPDAG